MSRLIGIIRFGCALLALQTIFLGVALAQEQRTYEKLYVGEELKPFWQQGKGRWYFGGGDVANPKFCGPWIQFDYSGKGDLPKPIEISIPLAQVFPIGRSYSVFVRHYWQGSKMSITVGDIARDTTTQGNPQKWGNYGMFEPNEPFDHIVLRYYPTMTQDNGMAQSQRNFLMGIFITTDMSKLPRNEGEVVRLLAQEVPAPIEGNGIANASFEGGLCGWGKSFGTTYVLTPDNLDDSTAADGRYSLKISGAQARASAGMGFDKGFSMDSKMVRLAPGAYTLSFYARSTNPVTVTAHVLGAGTGGWGYSAVAKFTNRFSVGNEWKRYSFTGTIGAMPGYMYTARISADVKPEDTLWLDAVQLEPGATATDFRIHEEVQAGIVGRQLGNIFWEKDPGDVKVLIYNPNNKDGVSLSYSITDYWNKTVTKGEKQVALASKANAALSLPLPTDKRGIFRLAISTGDSVSELVYSVLPPNPNMTRKYPEGTLGGEAIFGPYYLSVLKRANFSWVMSKGLARWAVVEPEMGKYTFNDAALQAADETKMMVSLQPFPGLPYQVSRMWLKDLVKPDEKSGKAWEQKDEYLKKWGEFVFQLVGHFKDTVKYWEIENEPNWEFTAAEYVDILNVASDNAKRADPEAKVVGFSGGGFPAQFYGAVAAGAKMDRVDVISVHLYGNVERDFKLISAFLKKYGKPGWNTETGRAFPSFYSTSTMMRYDQYVLADYENDVKADLRDRTVFTVKNYLLTLSLGGCERYFYYTTRFNNSSVSEPTWKMSQMDLMEYDGGLRASGVGLSIGSHFLDGSKYYGAVSASDRMSIYLFRKGQGTVGFMWTNPGTAPVKITTASNKALAFYDIMGNPIADGEFTLDDGPVYLTSNEDVEKAAAALKTMTAQ